MLASAISYRLLYRYQLSTTFSTTEGPRLNNTSYKINKVFIQFSSFADLNEIVLSIEKIWVFQLKTF